MNNLLNFYISKSVLDTLQQLTHLILIIPIRRNSYLQLEMRKLKLTKISGLLRIIT